MSFLLPFCSPCGPCSERRKHLFVQDPLTCKCSCKNTDSRCKARQLELNERTCRLVSRASETERGFPGAGATERASARASCLPASSCCLLACGAGWRDFAQWCGREPCSVPCAVAVGPHVVASLLLLGPRVLAAVWPVPSLRCVSSDWSPRGLGSSCWFWGSGGAFFLHGENECLGTLTLEHPKSQAEPRSPLFPDVPSVGGREGGLCSPPPYPCP